MHVGVIRDVVAVVLEGRWVERQEPDRCDAEVLDVVEFLRHPAEIADTVGYAVAKGAHVDFVDDGVLVPGDVGSQIHAVGFEKG